MPGQYGLCRLGTRYCLFGDRNGDWSVKKYSDPKVAKVHFRAAGLSQMNILHRSRVLVTAQDHSR